MFNPTLTQAVEKFTSTMLPLSEKDLEINWVWKDHNEEGIRFAFFVTLQELRQLAVTLSALRPKPKPSWKIASQYHAVFMDLQAALLDVSLDDSEKAPAEGEWPVRSAYAHILGTDIGFTAVIRSALERHRAGNWTPDQMTDAEADRLVNMIDEEYEKLTNEPLKSMQEFHRRFHQEIIHDFERITDEELDLPSTFWEETRFSIRHRLHRYEAHHTQHIIQIDKTLAAIDKSPTESKRLIRKIYAALAEAEGMMIGSEIMDDTAILNTASSIMERTKEIAGLLRGT